MAIARRRTSPDSGRALLEKSPGAHPPFPVVTGGPAALLAVAVGVAVFVMGAAALHLRPEGSSVAAWWPATAVAVGALALVHRQSGPLVLVAVGLGTLAAHLTADRPWQALVGFVVADMMTPWLLLRLMTRRGDHPQLLSVEELGRFVRATFVATGAAGLVAGLGVQLASGQDLLITWGAFAGSHATAVLLLVPCALVLPAATARPRPAELAAQLVALAAALFMVFTPERLLPLGLLPLPVLLWAAVRFPARWVAAELVLAGVVSTTLTTAGRGPYAAVVDAGLPSEMIGVLLQAALLVYVLGTLPLTLLVHQQRSALSHAEDSNKLLQSVLTGATATAIIGFARDGTITFFNAGAENMLGYRAGELVGRSTPERLHTGEEVEARAAELGVPPGMQVFTAVVDGGAPSERRDWTLVRRDGTHLTVALRVTRRVSTGGEHLGYLGVGEDVTERRRTEVTLRDALDREREALERLEQLDKAKTTFVSTVSHELRTPMTSVLGYTDMVLDEAAGPINPEQRVMLEAAQRNGRRLLLLIEDLLTVSLIEDGSFALEAEPVDLRETAKGALEAIGPLLVDRRLALETDLGERELLVVGDGAHLERVAINLVANAVKFTPDGGAIGVRVGSRGDGAFLEVSDTGIGIPEDEQPLLFERFFRSTNAQELEVPGTGLGLSIVKTIVASHGGNIRVQSLPGRGTTFSVELPLQTAG
jgi:PAS domain S-box-containing protein